MAKSFLSRVSPSRDRSRLIDWPFAVEGGDAPKVRVHVLGTDKLEAANLEAADHFYKRKGVAVGQTDAAFVARERCALVWYAFRDEDGEPLADDVSEMAEESDDVIMALYREWSSFQAEVTTRPMTSAQMESFIEALKKNTQAEVPVGFPLSWLIELMRGLASRLAASTPENEHGS